MNLSSHSPRVALACSAKLHAFNLASELDKHDLLQCFFTGYATQKAPMLSKIFKRVDKENINTAKIKVNWLVGAGLKFNNDNAFVHNDRFDRWVARKLKTCKTANVFVGWSGMSLHALKAAKGQNMLTVLERGSAHINFQNRILKEEYALHGHDFNIDPRVIHKECQEYDLADYIVVPSSFAARTFIEAGLAPSKIIQIPLGVPTFFNHTSAPAPTTPRKKFRIVFLGALIVRKGLIYLFEALKKLNIPESAFEVWLLGHISAEVQALIPTYQAANWTIMGHVGFQDIPDLLTQCDVGVFPSVEDGFAMVIPQMLACGLPVITTPHTGGPDLIQDGENGFIVPIRDSNSIAERLEFLYHNRAVCQEMGQKAAKGQDLSWEAYGDRYRTFLNGLFEH